ncbi:MAG: hypothetical protein K2X27_04475 [Candidatus Obscuribacterales bacterium]|nr:hypothetical protein [Candidatus Obscuribacterales bacterium]
MSDYGLDRSRADDVKTLAHALERNFDRIDSNHDGGLSRDELKDAVKSPKLSTADRELADFAVKHFEELSSLYRGLNNQWAESKLPQIKIEDNNARISKNDLNIMLKVAGDPKAGDPFVHDRKLFVGANAAIDATYGAYGGAAGGPLGALVGAGVGGAVGWGVFRLSHRLYYGSSDTYYQSKAKLLNQVDFSKLPRH